MKLIPREKPILRKGTSFDGTLTLQWNSLFNQSEINSWEDYTYGLYWDGGDGRSMEKLASVIDTNYDLRTYD